MYLIPFTVFIYLKKRYTVQLIKANIKITFKQHHKTVLLALQPHKTAHWCRNIRPGQKDQITFALKISIV